MGRARADDRVLEKPDVAARGERVHAQVEDQVGGELAGGVVGEQAAAGGGVEGGQVGGGGRG